MNAEIAVRQSNVIGKVSQPRSGKLRWLIIVSSLPFVVAFMLFGALGIREFRANRELATMFKQRKMAGMPYDNASIQAWYDRRTHNQGTADWTKIIELVSFTSNLQGNAITSEQFPYPKSLASASLWPQEPTIAEYLREMQPVLQSIHNARSHPTPVRFPIQFRGYETLLPFYQEARSVNLLLELDFVHACYTRDSSRAMNDWKSMQSLVDTIDSELFMVVDMLAISVQLGQREKLRRSLEIPWWNPEDLDALRDSIKEVRFQPDKWKSVIASEQLLLLESAFLDNANDVLRGPEFAQLVWIPLLPSGKLKLLKMYDSMRSLGDVPLVRLKQAASQLDQDFATQNASFDSDGSRIWARLFRPAIASFAMAVEREENDRRLALTTIGIRQFRHRMDRWPTELAELHQVGLQVDDYSTLNGGLLGYIVEDDVATVWSYHEITASHVRETRPMPNEEWLWSGATTLR